MSWLKIETTTPRKPEVFRIAGALNISPREAFGLCFDFWAWMDEISMDGSNAIGVTKSLLDRYLGVTGAADAIEKAGWLVTTEGGVSIPNGSRHNGETAKHRALAAKRQAGFKHKTEVGNTSTVTKITPVTLPREEKNREEKNRIENTNTGESVASATAPIVAEKIKRFVVPTIDEVSQYCKTNAPHVDPVKWWNHYNMVGWKAGKNKMVCWHSAVAKWERENRPVGSSTCTEVGRWLAEAWFSGVFPTTPTTDTELTPWGSAFDRLMAGRGETEASLRQFIDWFSTNVGKIGVPQISKPEDLTNKWLAVLQASRRE